MGVSLTLCNCTSYCSNKTHILNLIPTQYLLNFQTTPGYIYCICRPGCIFIICLLHFYPTFHPTSSKECIQDTSLTFFSYPPYY